MGRGARALAQHQPELVLLDIRMPLSDGFSALQDHEKPYVIFATAHAEHAVRAFDMEAVDYLLKPFDDERFERVDSSREGCDPRAAADERGAGSDR